MPGIHIHLPLPLHQIRLVGCIVDEVPAGLGATHIRSCIRAYDAHPGVVKVGPYLGMPG